MDAAAELGRNPVSKHQIQPEYGEMSRLTRDGTAEPVSRDQILRHARGQGNIIFPCSADHEQDWQPYPVDPYFAICDDHTYSEDCSGDASGDDDNGNENRIGEGGSEAKTRKKPQNSCRRRAGNGGEMGGTGKKCRKERVGSVAANPDNLGSNKELGGGGTRCSGLK